MTLFDNTYQGAGVILGNGEILLNPGALWFNAQPFRTDGKHTTITEIRLALGQVGMPDGELRISLWDDDAGVPGQVIEQIGTIADVSLLPPVERGQEIFEEFTFEQEVSGLEPNSTYYVVLDFDDVQGSEGIGMNVGIGAPRSSNGTHDAGPLLGRLKYRDDWFDLRNSPLGETRYLQMAISAIPGIVLGDFDVDGVLTASDIDRLTEAIVIASQDAKFDLDGNGTIDRLDHSYWVENLSNTWRGDANLDGKFNSADMVEVFQAGKYEINVDAGWAQGDWTGDRRFDSGDLVVAFQDGGYELAAGGAVSAVPEPGSVTLLWMGMTVICRLRQRRKCMSAESS